MTSMLEALKRIDAVPLTVRPARQPETAPEEAAPPTEEATLPAEGTAEPIEETEEPSDEALSAVEEQSTDSDESCTAAEEPSPAVEEACLTVEEEEVERPAAVEESPEPVDEPIPPAEPDVATTTPAMPSPEVAIEQPRRREWDWDIEALLARSIAGRDRPYRDLAANILSQLDPAHPSAVLFVSLPNGQGSALSLARLATMLAGDVRGEVLVVDVDLESPALAEEFGVAAERGLADVLLDAASWKEVIRPSDVERLAVLPGRPFPAAEVPEFQPIQLARLLDELRRHYRLVLLDGGSLWPEEAASWTRFCDGAYLVLKLGETTAQAASQSAELLEREGGRVLGAVLMT